MKILIYTSENMGAFNTYNISRLMSERPQHEYLFVVIKGKGNDVDLVTRFKRFVVELRDGKNYLSRDQEQLDRDIMRQCDISIIAKASTVYVEQVNDIASQDAIRQFAPDIILQAGAGILKAETFSLARKATLNVHHGYAPEIRGILSTFWCLYYALTDYIGVTCHMIDATLDTGDVVCQYRYPYTKGDTFLKIQQELCKKGAETLIRSVDLFDENKPAVREATEVDSYYLSKVDYRKYTALMKNNFLPVENHSNLKTKRKPKVFYFGSQAGSIS